MRKTGRIARWATLLSEYEPFSILYRSGATNKVADALSRVYAWSECLPDVAFCCMAVKPPAPQKVKLANPFDLIACPSTKQIKIAQQHDAFCSKRINSLSKFPIYTIENDLLGIRRENIFRPVLPETFVVSFIQSIHSNPLVAHMGAKRVASRCAEMYVIDRLRKHCRKICAACLSCQQRKTVAPRVGKLSSTAPTRAWEMVSMDFSGPYIKSARGNTYVLVIIDQFTKYVNLIPCERADSGSVLRALYERIICVHDRPEKLLTDNGSHFVNAAISAACESFRIYKVQSSPYYPQGDGQVERFMRNMNDSLSCLVQGDAHDWCEFVAGVQYAYNSTPHSATNVAPYEAVFGKPPPPLVRLEHVPSTKLSTPAAKAYANRLKTVVTRIQTKVKHNVDLAWMRRAIQFNAGRSKIAVTVGQHTLVRLSPLQLSKQELGKLRVKWSEPVLVTAVRSSGNAFEVKDRAGRSFVVNATRLLPLPPASWKPQATVYSLRWNANRYEPRFTPISSACSPSATMTIRQPIVEAPVPYLLDKSHFLLPRDAHRNDDRYDEDDGGSGFYSHGSGSRPSTPLWTESRSTFSRRSSASNDTAFIPLSGSSAASSHLSTLQDSSAASSSLDTASSSSFHDHASDLSIRTEDCVTPSSDEEL